MVFTGEIPVGQPASRIDGPLKVTGAAQYSAEYDAPDIAYGVIVNSTIAKGRITSIDATASLAVAGALSVISHLNRPHVRSWRLFYKDMVAPGGKPFRPLYDASIAFSGQPVALVVAETFEAARYAARLLDVRTQVEWSFVGRIEGALELEFMHYPGMTPNPNFVDSLKGVVTPDDLLLFLCRTGGRSNAAATAATSAGYGKCYNILEGFEGDLNADGQRNKVNGWRAAGLPWKQA